MSNLYAHPAFCSALAEAVPYQEVRALGARVFVARRYGHQHVVVPPHQGYTGFEGSPGDRLKALHALQDAFPVGRWHDGIDAEPLMVMPEGMRRQDLKTYVIDFNGTPILDRWSQSPRRTLRKEQAGFLPLEPAPTEIMVDLLRSSYARHRRRLPLRSDKLGAMVTTLREMGLVEVLGIRAAAAPHPWQATVAVLAQEREAAYWLAGSVAGPAMTVLLGQLLPRMQEEGWERFDFAGANTPTIAEFKRRLGPKLVPYSAYTWNRGLWKGMKSIFQPIPTVVPQRSPAPNER